MDQVSNTIALKVSTAYSFGAVYGPIKEVVASLAQQGCTAAAMVDSDTWGHVQWYNACKAAGIEPLLGVSWVVSDEADRTPKMWFLARNTEGLSELYTALSKSYHQRVPTAYGTKPRLYRSDVLGFSDNVLVFAGDISDKGFISTLAKLRPNTFYIDLCENGSMILNAAKRTLAASLSVPVVGVRNNDYLDPSTASMLDYLPAGRGSTQDRSLRLPQALGAEVQVVEQCKGLELPRAPMISMQGDIEEVCRAAISERFPNGGWTDVYEHRLQHELKEIKAKSFDSYFLLVSDMAREAKKSMLVGPSRGSAAGSLVCYLMHITEIDPVPPGLYFERFIDQTRKDLPDIDLDFPDVKREQVIEYLRSKWGVEHVAHVGSVAVFKPKSALVQVCKRLGIPSHATAAVKSAMLERSESDPRALQCLADTLDTTDAGRLFKQAYPAAYEATKLEGHPVRTGTHAAGVLVCNEPVTRYAVVDDSNIAHIDKHDLEQLNLLKIDVLGLRTLTVLEDAGVDIDWYNLPLNDPDTYAVFNRLKLCGVFQFEGSSMHDLASASVFDNINDVDAITALARPGPLNSGVAYQWVQYRKGQLDDKVLPVMRQLLPSTYGLPLYQENTMKLVREVGGFSWEQTSYIRKAISKSKGPEAIKQLTSTFMAGAAARGIDHSTAAAIWEQISAMGAWQMNKAHTYSYAVVSYWTAYLKAHYSLHFAASCLRHAKDEASAIAILRELMHEGYHYTYFDPYRSAADWSVVGDPPELLGGFKSLKGIGDSKAAKLIEKRDHGLLCREQAESLLDLDSPFKDLFPLTNKYASYYEGRENVVGDVYHIADIGYNPPHGLELVFLGALTSKECRDINEGILVRRRGGKVVPPNEPHTFLDLHLKDDTGEIGARISRWDYERLGKWISEAVPIGSTLLVRARFWNGVRFAFITKVKLL